MDPKIRMEQVALSLSSTLFERLTGPFDETFLNTVLVAIFTSLHFYRNNTKSKTIPASIMKTVHLFLSNFMINHGSQPLITACNKIQPGILFMILNSEAEKIKYVQAPSRDKKYISVAYARLASEFSG
jgi:hypothetical protein